MIHVGWKVLLTKLCKLSADKQALPYTAHYQDSSSLKSIGRDVVMVEKGKQLWLLLIPTQL